MFYRTPEAIKRDIRTVVGRIGEINELLNIRELVSEAMANDARIVRYAEALDELTGFADEALEELRGLSETLDRLKEEFITTIQSIN